MTVAELIAKLQEMPPDALVVTRDAENDGFYEICGNRVAHAWRRDSWCSGWWEQASPGESINDASVARVVVLSDDD